MSRKCFVFFAIFLLSFIFLAPSVIAQSTLPPPLSPSPTPCVATPPNSLTPVVCVQVDQKQLGFNLPNMSDILTFAIRAIFVFAGLAALLFLILGAFSWITSGGEKDAIAKAQAKIQAAVLGIIMIAVVLAIVVTLEQVVFAGKVCFGISCPITIPPLLKSYGTPSGAEYPTIKVDLGATGNPVPPPTSVKSPVPSPPKTGGDGNPGDFNLTPHPY